MSENPFEKGERVKAIRGPYKGKIGVVGTFYRTSSVVYVSWDYNSDGIVGTALPIDALKSLKNGLDVAVERYLK